MIEGASESLLLKRLRIEVEKENSQGTGFFKRTGFFNFFKKTKPVKKKVISVRDKFVEHAEKNKFEKIDLNKLTAKDPTEYYSVSDKDVLFLGSFIENKQITYNDRPDGMYGPITKLTKVEYHFKNDVITLDMDSVLPIIYGAPAATEGGRKRKSKKTRKTKKSRKTRRKSTRRR